MKKDNQSAAAILRQKAEELLRKNILETGSLFSDIDALKISHELEVYHIELQLQNDELMLAKSSERDATEKYTELYDFAPSGYFTVSKEGNIIEINLCGSQMLGADRSRIKSSNFGFFVSDDTKPIFNSFLENVFNSRTKETGEVTLSVNGKLPVYVHLTGIATENGEKCLVTMVDITERKLAEEALNEKMDELVLFHNLTVGRELKMIELKKEINELLRKSGQAERHVIVE
ncbi:MAG: PAS domain-containing protein [Bacteroidia bacterium]|nr:PAS domain-containing protein [Bacteroidia bacterium]